MIKELWKDIPGYEGFYQVSNMGQVRSVTHSITMKNGVNRTIYSKILVLHPGGNNEYLQAYLHKDNKVTNFLVHRLVANAFIASIPSGYEVNHKNGNKTDNRVQNLEIVTHQENITHSMNNSLFRALGEDHYASKLTNAQASEIRDIYSKGGISQKKLGLKYGVTQKVIFSIVNNKTYMQ